MFIAMNRFKVERGSEEDFENIWKGRDSKLGEMAGFVSFNLLRGSTNEDEGFTLFASHTIWKTKSDFEAWTKSQNFRDAHRNAGSSRSIYKGPPVFEGFEVVEGA